METKVLEAENAADSEIRKTGQFQDKKDQLKNKEERIGQPQRQKEGTPEPIASADYMTLDSNDENDNGKMFTIYKQTIKQIDNHNRF